MPHYPEFRGRDVEVRTVRLPDDEMGGWVPELGLILLDDRLTPVELKCTVAHERVHAERGDQCLDGHGPDGGRLERRQELVADRVAALRLVVLEDLADALAHTESLAAAAEVLEVDEDTLWNRLNLGLDDAEKAYLQARIDQIEEKAWPTT